MCRHVSVVTNRTWVIAHILYNNKYSLLHWSNAFYYCIRHYTLRIVTLYRIVCLQVKRTLPLLLLVVVLCTRPATNQEPATERYTKLFYMCIGKCETEMYRCAREYDCNGMGIPRICVNDCNDCIDDCRITCKKIISH